MRERMIATKHGATTTGVHWRTFGTGTLRLQLMSETIR